MPVLTKILTDPAANGVYRLTTEVPDLPGLIHIDARRHADKDGLLEAIGQALQFPDYYGRNWDALEECLFDLSWWQGPVAICIDHAGALPPDVLATLVDVWTEAAHAWAKAGRGCSLLLEGAVGMDDLPVASV